MDTKHRVWSGSPQASKRRPRGPCAYILILNYYTRALEKPERPKPEALFVSATTNHHGETWSAMSWVRIPRGIFWKPFLLNLAIMIVWFSVPILCLVEAHLIVMLQLTVIWMNLSIVLSLKKIHYKFCTAQWSAFVLPDPAAPGLIPGIP